MGQGYRSPVGPPPLRRGPHLRSFRRRPTLPGGNPPSTIGADRLNFRVRDGNGCDSVAMATGKRAQQEVDAAQANRGRTHL